MKLKRTHLSLAIGIALIAAGWAFMQVLTGPADHTVKRETYSDLSNAKAYTSLQALRADATSVAIVQPTPVSHIETISGVSFTVKTVNVEKTVSGATLPQTIELRQAPDPQVPQSIVTPANTYLAFLQPFQFTPGTQVGDQYVVVGYLQGLFASAAGTSASNTTTFTAVAPGPPGLPSQVTPAQAAASG